MLVHKFMLVILCLVLINICLPTTDVIEENETNTRRNLQEKDIARLNSIRSWNAQLVQGID